MQWIRDLSLRYKLLLGILATCMAALTLACSALFWFQSVTFRKGFVAELESLGSIMARSSAAPLAFGDRRSADEVLASLKIKPQIVSARIFDSQGKLFSQLGAEPASAIAGPGRDHVTLVDGYAYLSLPIVFDDATPGRFELVARYRDEQRRLLSLYGAVMAGVFVGSLLLILAMSSAMQRIITRPIMTLAEIAQGISEKEDYSARARETGRDEVGLLTRTFNEMLDRIQSRDTRLRESQQRYEVAVMGSSDGLWDFDLGSNVVYFSPRWKAIAGYADHELENTPKTFHDLLHPDDFGRVFEKISQYLDGKSGWYEAEFRMRHKDGSYRWVLSRGAALRDDRGKALRFAGSHTDITERKLAETALRVSREKFESLVNSIDGVVWEARPSSNAFTFVSQKAEHLLGYALAEWTSGNSFWADHLHPDDRDTAIRLCSEAAARREVIRLEFRMIAADGREVWIRDMATVNEGPDGDLLLRGVMFDISEQKKAEHEMDLLNQKLRDASREAGMAEIATGVLHNVGNVLNSVNVSASLAVDQLRKSKSASLTKAVQLLRENQPDLGTFLTQDARGRQLPGFLSAVSDQILKEQATLATELQGLQQNIEHIKQIVAMQQSYAKVAGALESLPAHELVEDALRISSSGLLRHHVEVVRDFAPVPAVQVDRHKVLQILVNLINNAKHALDHREEGRRLTLQVSALETGRVRVEVRDNGMGIPPENLTRIFQHGFTTKKTGHGFGLHSGANAARELGGSLQAFSDGPGLGARFVLELPAAAPAAANPPRDLALPRSGIRAA